MYIVYCLILIKCTKRDDNKSVYGTNSDSNSLGKLDQLAQLLHWFYNQYCSTVGADQKMVNYVSSS